MHVFALQFDWDLFGQRIVSPDGAFFRALGTTVYVAVVAQSIGVLLGVASALAGLSRNRFARAASYLYTLVIRGTPVIVQIFFMYFGANLLLGFDLFPRTADFGAFSIDGAVLAGIAALGINEGAYMSEICRAGIAAVDPGQSEAALSVGMRRRTAMRRIVLPQAARVVVPPLGNEFNNMLKTTSLLAFIGVYELFQDAEVRYSTSFKPVEYFAAVAVWYLVLTTLWSLVQVQIERRLGQSDRIEGEGFLTRFLGLRPAPQGLR